MKNNGPFQCICSVIVSLDVHAVVHDCSYFHISAKLHPLCSFIKVILNNFAHTYRETMDKSQFFTPVFYQGEEDLAKISSSCSKISIHWRDKRDVFTSKPLTLSSRDKEAR